MQRKSGLTQAKLIVMACPRRQPLHAQTCKNYALGFERKKRNNCYPDQGKESENVKRGQIAAVH